MTKNTPKRSNLLVWIACGILVILGIALAIHALLTFDQAEVVVEWTTASELDTIGFNLLRGNTPAGPFEQVNPELIPTTSDSLTGGNYSYEDDSVQVDITYFYMLEEIENTGRTNQHGPIVVKASNPAKTELLLAGFLIGGSVFYAVILLREPKRKSLPQETA